MKVAYFAESPADQAALTILTEAILGQKTESIGHAGLRHRGWPTVRTVLPAVLKELHYIETDVMKAAATRLSQNLSTIERLFPHGFGALVKSLRTW